MEAGIGGNTSEAADSTGNGNTYLEGWCGTEDREHHLQTADGQKVNANEVHTFNRTFHTTEEKVWLLFKKSSISLPLKTLKQK